MPRDGRCRLQRPRVRRALRRMAHEIQRYFTKNPEQLQKIHAQEGRKRPRPMERPQPRL